MDASEFLKYKNWVVVGDVLNTKKYANRIYNELKEAGYNVAGVNMNGKNDGSFNKLSEVPFKIDVVDLCINHVKGLEAVTEAGSKLHIDKILIQPGAESSEILDYCKNSGIIAIEGCALVELSHASAVR
ncbi:MAG: CoA-binding protein [Bacillota bacterium]|nr:CoA-binding protein [Bacillota bacterium]